MIWILLVLFVLCVAMSCVALWYRDKWRFEEDLRICLQKDLEIADNRRLHLEYEVEWLRSQLPKRDSRGRYCKK